MRSRLLKRAAEFSLPDLSKPTLNLQEPTKPLPGVLPKRSPLAERSSSSPFSFTNNQGKVLPAISSTTGALFGPQGSFKSPFSKPTPDESHNLPFLSREQSHKPNLTSGQHYEQGFAPYQQKLDFTGRENFAKNLPYDPANRSQEYDNRVETLNSADAKAVNNPELYGKFKEKADQEYINNMFRHTKAPEGYKRTSVSTGPSGSHYNTFTNKLVLDQDSDIKTYMHELTHGLGALSRRIPLWDRSQIAYQPDPDSKPSTGFNPLGDKYSADSEYPAMMAGRLAQLKTDQRANEMVHSTKLPAQLAGALASPNPFASTVGALAGNKGSATLTMPGGDIINPDKQKDIKDNYLRSVNTAFGEANRNNYFTPKSVEDTANIYPTLNKALPHMMLEKQNSDFLSLLRLEKQAIGARSKRLASRVHR